MIKELYKIWADIDNKKIMVITSNNLCQLQELPRKQINNLLGLNKLSISQLLNNPNEIWQYIIKTRKEIIKLNPNVNHYALVQLEQRFKQNFSLITNSMDNLHNEAGSVRLVEMYGNIFKEKVFSKDELESYNKNWLNIPKNKKNQFLKPNIKLRDELISKKNYLQAYLIAQQCDVCIVIEMDSKDNQMYELPLIAKRFNNAKIIEINPKDNIYKEADIYIKAYTEEILPLLVDILIELEDEVKNYL